MAIFDEHLISRFEWMRHGARDSLSTPPVYMTFDVLQVGSQDLRQEPLRTRRVNAFSSPLGDSQEVA